MPRGCIHQLVEGWRGLALVQEGDRIPEAPLGDTPPPPSSPSHRWARALSHHCLQPLLWAPPSHHCAGSAATEPCLAPGLWQVHDWPTPTPPSARFLPWLLPLARLNTAPPTPLPGESPESPPTQS